MVRIVGEGREKDGRRSWRCLRPRRHTNCETQFAPYTQPPLIFFPQTLCAIPQGAKLRSGISYVQRQTPPLPAHAGEDQTLCPEICGGAEPRDGVIFLRAYAMRLGVCDTFGRMRYVWAYAIRLGVCDTPLLPELHPLLLLLGEPLHPAFVVRVREIPCT